MFSRQFPIKRTNSHGHTTIIERPNLFCQKSSSHSPKKKTSFKNAQKKHFSGKVILRYFQKYVRYGSNVFGGTKHIPWAHSEAIIRLPTLTTANPPSPLVNSCLFSCFLSFFYLQYWLV